MVTNFQADNVENENDDGDVLRTEAAEYLREVPDGFHWKKADFPKEELPTWKPTVCSFMYQLSTFDAWCFAHMLAHVLCKHA